MRALKELVFAELNYLKMAMDPTAPRTFIMALVRERERAREVYEAKLRDLRGEYEGVWLDGEMIGKKKDFSIFLNQE